MCWSVVVVVCVDDVLVDYPLPVVVVVVVVVDDVDDDDDDADDDYRLPSVLDYY